MIQISHSDAWEFIRTMSDKSVDLILTDPMYNAVMDMVELRRICKGHIIMFCAPLKPFFQPDDLQYWLKTPSTKNFSKSCGHFIEWIIFEFHGDTFNADLHWSNYTGFHDDKILTKSNHPYQKPQSLLERLISIYSNPGDTVFDPFFGSGSVLFAAENVGRDSLGCENDGSYFYQCDTQVTGDLDKVYREVMEAE
ncbi:MAG TPA: DNA methyltransferase [Anaerolineales bacterium]|nr:DNA methyltransferase [Anaerolineales bacterium]